MNNLISLEEAKKHLRVLHNHEDPLIQSFIDAAVDNVAMYIDRDLDGYDLMPFETELVNSVPTLTVPPRLKPSLYAAALLICGDLYKNRESQTTNELKLNPTLERLMEPYRKMGV